MVELVETGKRVGSVTIDLSQMAEGTVTKGWYPIECHKPHFIVTCEVGWLRLSQAESFFLVLFHASF